ncbi:unnamed protein product [Orchesella dallaii]|uniref:PHD-type domain-containing protein n=1 Tax=Orchesella dallaii TaxID=48710 RepID=A0ABP1RKL9_9HEXA
METFNLTKLKEMLMEIMKADGSGVEVGSDIDRVIIECGWLEPAQDVRDEVMDAMQAQGYDGARMEMLKEKARNMIPLQLKGQLIDNMVLMMKEKFTIIEKLDKMLEETPNPIPEFSVAEEKRNLETKSMSVENGRGASSSSSPNAEEAYSSEASVLIDYCSCKSSGGGEMITCDNSMCPIEKYHLECLGLEKKPQAEWFCEFCRGEDNKKMMDWGEFINKLAHGRFYLGAKKHHIPSKPYAASPTPTGSS